MIGCRALNGPLEDIRVSILSCYEIINGFRINLLTNLLSIFSIQQTILIRFSFTIYKTHQIQHHLVGVASATCKHFKHPPLYTLCRSPTRLLQQALARLSTDITHSLDYASSLLRPAQSKTKSHHVRARQGRIRSPHRALWLPPSRTFTPASTQSLSQGPNLTWRQTPS